MTGSGESVLVTDRSASAIWVVVVAVLSVVSGSVSLPATDAVLVSVPVVAVAVTTIITVALAPLARVPRAQVTVPLQLPWLAGVTAASVYQQILFGRDNPFAYLNIGTVETVSELTLDEVKQFHAKYYSPRIANIVAVSNFGQESLFEKLGDISDFDPR